MSREPQFAELKSVNAAFAKVATNMTGLSNELAKLQSWRNEVLFDKQIQAQQELVDRLQSHSMSYTNVVVGVGYAGFFALWNMVEKLVPQTGHARAGIAIGVSLLLFVGWEVVRMIWSSMHLKEVQKTMGGEVRSNLQTFANAAAAHERRMYSIWHWVLWPTVISGAYGAGTLLWYLAADLIPKASGG